MSSSGLTQRRRAGGENTQQSDDYEGSQRVQSSLNPHDKDKEDADFEFKADEDGFCDQDLEGKKVKLTQMEEILLLALRDQQGYYSWWNENMSYVLRGCMLIELAMRNKVSIFKEPAGRHHKRDYMDRLLDVIDDSPTGEILLDEALKIMKMEQSTDDGKPSARHSITDWIDLLSGETWNVLKFSFQMKQRALVKGLVDKGILRTEKRNFLVFEMTTHPVTDGTVKAELIQRILNALLGRGVAATRRTVALCAAAYAANVMDNALAAAATVGTQLSYSQKDGCFAKCEEILVDWSGSRETSATGSGKLSGGGEGAFRDMSEKAKLGWTDVMSGVLGVFLKMDSVL